MCGSIVKSRTMSVSSTGPLIRSPADAGRVEAAHAEREDCDGAMTRFEGPHEVAIQIGAQQSLIRQQFLVREHANGAAGARSGSVLEWISM
jgi:hypothetical protein